MRRTRLGRSDLEVSTLCLGTMTWGSQTGIEDAHRQIDIAREAGINFLDSAEMYPVNPVAAETVGRTEEILGDWIARSGRRDEMVIATKITGEGQNAVRGGAPITPDAIRAAVDASLRRLRTDYIDLYQFHWPNRGSYHFRQHWAYSPAGQETEAVRDDLAACLGALDGLVKAGKIRHFGLSNDTAWGVMQMLAMAGAGVGPRVQSIQNEYSLLCRHYDTDLAELSHHEDITLLAFSPLAAGLLTGKYAGDVAPEGTRRAANPTLGGRITPRVWEAVSAYMGVANTHGLDPVTMAIAFILSRPFPAVPILGASRADQLPPALAAAETTLGEEVLADLAAAHKAHPMPY